MATDAASPVAEPRWRAPGGSTAAGGVVEYRIAKLEGHRPVRGRWLDCGCCDGGYTAGLMAAGASTAIGMEIDPQRARAAEEAAGAPEGPRPRFLAASSELMPFSTGSFDGVLLNEVLEHVDDQQATLRQVARVLRPGGCLALFSPNRWFPFEGHGMRCRGLGIGSPVPLLPWLPRRATASVMQARNYWPKELATLVAEAGLRVQAVDWALPLLSHYPWLPRPLADRYRTAVPRLDKNPIIRRFGVSTLVVGVKS